MADQRLIDAAALLKNSDVFTFHSREYGSIEVIAVDAIGDAPTVDAVEVVRCKDCVYNENGTCTHSECFDDTKYRPDYFCADGERREGE